MKRSRSIALVMMGAGTIALTACEQQQVEVSVFQDVEQCVNEPGASRTACEEAFGLAEAQHAVVAPKYTDQEVCEADFGVEQCEQAPSEAQGGGSIFMPLMMGYMMGSMMSGRAGAGAAAQPLYRSADDPRNFRTADNRSVGAATGRTTVSRAAAAPPTAKSHTVARGGFGDRARSIGPAST
jgi:uncharacterized protein YgiB involved in biofilm formation